MKHYTISKNNFKFFRILSLVETELEFKEKVIYFHICMGKDVHIW